MDREIRIHMWTDEGEGLEVEGEGLEVEDEGKMVHLCKIWMVLDIRQKLGDYVKGLLKQSGNSNYAL